MKKTLFLLSLLPLIYYSQNFKDTLFKKDGKLIACTITFMNENNVFYTDKGGEGQMLSLNVISKYSQNNIQTIITKKKPADAMTDSMATVNGELVRKLKTNYLQIMGVAKLFRRKIIIQIDYGQIKNAFKSKATRILDGQGNIITFNSMVDALNFFSLNGYEFVQSYAFIVGRKNVYHYLLKKKNV